MKLPNYLNLSMPSVSWGYLIQDYSLTEVVKTVTSKETFGRLYDIVERAWALKLEKTVFPVIQLFTFIWQMFHSPISCGRYFRVHYGTQPVLQKPSSSPTGVSPGNQVIIMEHPPPPPLSLQSVQRSWIKSSFLGIWNWYALGIVISGLEQANTQAMEQLSSSIYVKKPRKLAGSENRLKSDDREKQR